MQDETKKNDQPEKNRGDRKKVVSNAGLNLFDDTQEKEV
jgi:hypothetical protein